MSTTISCICANGSGWPCPLHPITTTTITGNVFIGANPTFTCSACKIEKLYDFKTHHYDGIKISRIICNTCYIKAQDKLYGINIGDLEETLYKK